MEVFNKIANHIASWRGINQNTITPDTHFSDLMLDSLEMLHFVLTMEESFSVTIALKDELDTIGSVAEYINNKLAVV